jgi:pimeloyl-ACP methyl ester carboxylesterase
MDGDLILIPGFWASPTRYDQLTSFLDNDPSLAGLRIHTFEYESPKWRFPFSPARIPDYNDIAQSLPAFLAAKAPGTTPIAFVTHSQGGLILQRFLAWMLTEGRGKELVRFRLVVMLSCPNEGSEYARSIRAVVGLRHNPQAKQLVVLDHEVGETRRIVLRQVVNAAKIDERNCPIPLYVYSGRTDNIVRRESALSVFLNVGVLPGDHFSILDCDRPGYLTGQTVRSHLQEHLTPLRRTGGRPTTSDSAFKPQILRRLYVQRPDGRVFELQTIPNTTLVGEISSSILDEYPSINLRDDDHQPGRTVTDLIRPGGKWIRLDSESSLHNADVREDSLLGVGIE